MILKADQQRVKALLSETITLLCKNGLNFRKEFTIEGLIGITLDQEDIFLVSINETIRSAVAEAAAASKDAPPSSGKRSSTGASVAGLNCRKNRGGPDGTADVKRSDSPLPPVITSVSSSSVADLTVPQETKNEYASARSVAASSTEPISIPSQASTSSAPTKLEDIESDNRVADIDRHESLAAASTAAGSSADLSDLNLTFSDIPTSVDSDGTLLHHEGSSAKRRRLANRHVPAAAGSSNDNSASGFEVFQSQGEQRRSDAKREELPEETDFIEIKDELLSDDE